MNMRTRGSKIFGLIKQPCFILIAVCAWPQTIVNKKPNGLIRHSPLVVQPLLTVVAAMRTPFTALLSASALQVAGPGGVLAAPPHVDAGGGRVGARLAPHAGVRPLDIRDLTGDKYRNQFIDMPWVSYFFFRRDKILCIVQS